MAGTNVASHIYLKNLYIHHIKGQLGNGESTVNGAIPKRTGGIYFTVLDETNGNNSRFDDVLIDSCTIAYCENTGLAFDNEDNIYYPGAASSSIAADVTEYNNWFARRYTKIKISNNTIHHIGKNAMIIRCADSTGLIERNVCYETAVGTTGNTMFTARCKGTVFQYNEGYYNRSTTQSVDPGTIDGSMYDADYGSVGVIFQYSYSHDNSEGIYWGCNSRSLTVNTSGTPDPGDKGCTLRYCISKNDMGDLIFFNYPSAGNEIYNNVFYIKSGLKPNIIHESGTKEHGYNYYNNIVYNLSSSAGFALANSVGDRTQTRSLSNNVFYNVANIPAEMSHSPTMQTTDPQFLSLSSTVTLGINSLGGFKLKPTSPFIGTGKIIANNGGQDYYGTALPTTTPNRGVYEGPGTLVLPVVFSNFTLQSQDGQVALQWQTATEQNTQYFDIERSPNGTDFSSIGKQSAAGNSTLKTTYQFVDRLPFSGTNYYRLKQVDKNGAVQYSAIKILNSPRLLDFQVYPNPANNLLFIKTNLPSSLKWKGTILNVKGELVKEILFANKLTDPIHIEQISTGVYVLKIVDAITNTVVAQTPFLKL